MGRSIWEDRQLGLALEADLAVVTTLQGTIELLCDHYPFIQIVANAEEAEAAPSLTILTTSEGWKIHDYGIALSIAAPHEQDATSNATQTLLTATQELIQIILAKGWQELTLVAGSMQLSAMLSLELEKTTLKLHSERLKIDLGKIRQNLHRYQELESPKASQQSMLQDKLPEGTATD